MLNLYAVAVNFGNAVCGQIILLVVYLRSLMDYINSL